MNRVALKPQLDLKDEKPQSTRDRMGADENDPWRSMQQWIPARLMTTGKTENRIRLTLGYMIGRGCGFTLELDWSPIEFLQEQYDAVTCRIQDVLCLCGAYEQVEALSCGEYAVKMWPDVGPSILRILSSAVDSGVGIHRGDHISDVQSLISADNLKNPFQDAAKTWILN